MRTRTATLSIAFFTVFAMATFAGGESEHPEPPRGAETGCRFEIELTPGPYYSKDVNLVVYRYTVWPQVAVWLETPAGDYVDTLYVTRVVVEGDYDAAPKDGRPEALPVWSHLQRAPSDAVTAATTTTDAVQFGSGVASSLDPGVYVVKLETNRSYDYNERYPRSETAPNGQPSVIYAAEITVGSEIDVVRPTPVGTGSVDGSDGEIRIGLDGIDTALELFESMQIRYLPD